MRAFGPVRLRFVKLWRSRVSSYSTKLLNSLLVEPVFTCSCGLELSKATEH